MPSNYSIPGVYVEEIPRFPPSVAQVETAIPAFIGYTAKALDETGNPITTPTAVRVTSFKEFETRFGAAPPLNVTEIRLDANDNFLGADISTDYYMHHAVQLFYANGGGDCFIVSIGAYATTAPFVTETDYTSTTGGLVAVSVVDEPTILLFPDAVKLSAGALGNIQKAALLQCADLQDRITLCDLQNSNPASFTDVDNFRQEIGINNLKYGAAYTPWLQAVLPKNVSYAQLQSVDIIKNGVTPAINLVDLAPAAGANPPRTVGNIIDELDTELAGSADPDILAPLEAELIASFGPYKAILAGLNGIHLNVPPSGAVAGVMATVDRTRGVWKAPANVSLNRVLGPTRAYVQSDLSKLNIDTTAGKSVNAIRAFTGKGTLIWGARTLAGNDNEWRYVNVRRFYNMVEESVKKATEQFVFEPNDANTWVRVQAMIENFLTLQWRQGALQGANQAQAFRVAVGLGKTMTAQDILEGRMIVEIAMAPVRPAEFIILRFEQKMPEA